MASGQPFVACFWHARMLMAPNLWPGDQPFHMLISRHSDGRFISRTIGHFGLDTVEGSSSRGGSRAVRELVRLLKAGACVGFTPDGPRGPRQRAADGVAAVARLAGVPILPVSYGTRFRILANSWDRFLIPLPFGRGAFVMGDPVTVPPDADADALEAARRAVEDELNQATYEADRLCGVATVEPAPAVEPAP